MQQSLFLIPTPSGFTKVQSGSNSYASISKTPAVNVQRTAKVMMSAKVPQSTKFIPVASKLNTQPKNNFFSKFVSPAPLAGSRISAPKIVLQLT